jgi:hypothetical protein
MLHTSVRPSYVAVKVPEAVLADGVLALQLPVLLPEQAREPLKLIGLSLEVSAL